jgi:hypothetical protein
MEAALRPGLFIRYGECFAFVQDLERIARSIDGLLAKAPERAAELFETFLAGCYQKSEEIDDSSGGFGELMQHLCCRWVRARQAAGSSADETVGTLLGVFFLSLVCRAFGNVEVEELRKDDKWHVPVLALDAVGLEVIAVEREHGLRPQVFRRSYERSIREVHRPVRVLLHELERSLQRRRIGKPHA